MALKLGRRQTRPQNRRLDFEVCEDRRMLAVSSPRISISDVSVIEGDSGTQQALLTVSLNDRGTRTSTVSYATSGGTAKSGEDFLSVSGKLTFSPGQTSKQIAIPIKGDGTVEGDESFSVKLSLPRNASISDSTGIVTIRNNDVTFVSVGNAIGVEGQGDPSAGSPYFHTSGNQILNADNVPVKIAGVSWYGMETAEYAPEGLWGRSYKNIMDQMKSLGFNTVRIPFSSQALLSNSRPTSIDYTINPDLAGLNSLQVLDKVVAYADVIGLKIILDHHRSTAGNDSQSGGLWFTRTYTESRWISDWKMLAQRYVKDPSVIAVDLHNEPYGAATWGTGGAYDWRLAAERAGNAVLSVNPNLLVIVEGVETTSLGSTWWGGNLSNADKYPVRLNVPGRLVYSAHDYGSSLYAEMDRFKDPTYPNNLPAVWDATWGYLYQQNIAPVFLGEFGSALDTLADQQWYDKLLTYLGGDFNADGTSDLATGAQSMSWTYWSWNPNFGDTGGIMTADWNGVNSQATSLMPIEFAFPPVLPTGPVLQNTISFAITLAKPSSQAITVTYVTAGVTALGGEDYVSKTGVITFNPGETAKTITVTLHGDKTVEEDETFSVMLSSAIGASIANGLGIGTIANDDLP